MTPAAFEEAPVYEVTAERLTDPEIGEMTFVSFDPKPEMWPGWESNQSRPAVERRREWMAAGRWRELYRSSARPEEAHHATQPA